MFSIRRVTIYSHRSGKTHGTECPQYPPTLTRREDKLPANGTSCGPHSPLLHRTKSIGFPFKSFSPWNSGSSLDVEICISCGKIAIANGKPTPRHAETERTSAAAATAPPAAMMGTLRSPAMIIGGKSIGMIGSAQLRERTVNLIDSVAAALDSPSVRPSGAWMGTPLSTSGQRVNATLPAPAATTAAYGTAIPSLLIMGGPRLTSSDAPTAIVQLVPTARA
mmetsp:Transcript_65021/g.89358  ORF Transcript_65021/g.89358 Transcript_65021/m.89358 type:complete len:222 (-) Transcript_65021:447-1112(-)